MQKRGLGFRVIVWDLGTGCHRIDVWAWGVSFGQWNVEFGRGPEVIDQSHPNVFARVLQLHDDKTKAFSLGTLCL